jgi:hypothetical protein
MTTFDDEARIRRRNAFLEGANDELFHVVTACAKSLPMREIAALIDADDEAARSKPPPARAVPSRRSFARAP